MTMSKQPIRSAIQVQIIAMAVLVSTPIYVVVCYLLYFTKALGAPIFGSGETTTMIGYVLLASGIGVSMLSFPIRKFLKTRTTDTSLESKLREVLTCLAVAEAGSIHGLVFFLLTHTWPIPMVLFTISLSIKILHFPLRGWIEETAPEE